MGSDPVDLKIQYMFTYYLFWALLGEEEKNTFFSEKKTKSLVKRQKPCWRAQCRETETENHKETEAIEYQSHKSNFLEVH